MIKPCGTVPSRRVREYTECKACNNDHNDFLALSISALPEQRIKHVFGLNNITENLRVYLIRSKKFPPLKEVEKKFLTYVSS